MENSYHPTHGGIDSLRKAGSPTETYSFFFKPYTHFGVEKAEILSKK